MKRALAAVGIALFGVAHAGHEFPFYPSFYPQEITVEALDAQSAARRLTEGTLHVYAGDVGADPAKTGAIESLGAFVVATLERNTPCDRAYAADHAPGERYTAHPYPVTPFHGDYLHHADRAAAAVERPKAPLPPGAKIERIDVRQLIARASTRYNGWAGPPWLRQGWFHAYLLLAPAVPEARIENTAQRLMRAHYRSLEERVALERNLVALLQGACARVVLGYTTRREHYGAGYSSGVENVGYDALEGLASAIFPRTVKLRDFPWNGWLNAAAPALPASAWNPVVGGFTDEFGALTSSAVFDAALLAPPQGGRWIENRVNLRPARGGAPLAVPENAWLPEPGTGRLRAVGRGKTAAARIVYDVRSSAFHDGTPMAVADVLYAYAFAAAWGGGAGADSGMARATALARDRLRGVRLLGVHIDTLAFGEDKLTYEVPRFEVYVNAVADAATVAPPWTALPWHLLALFGEGARRGFLTLSQFDPVRDAALVRRLAELEAELEERAYVPPALRLHVTAHEARARYRRLREFHEKHGHWLVTNGPYFFSRWDGAKAVLGVFRDPSYPKGLGSYNAYAVPLKAYVTGIERRPGGANVHLEAERLEREGREVRIVRGPPEKGRSPVCRYVLLGANGAVAAVGEVRAGADGRCDLRLKAGVGRLLVAGMLDGAIANAPIKMVPWE